MLGNFSIGDYFKEEAIIWSWEFLTSDQWIGFDKEKLSVTVHPEDHEAYKLWIEKVGVPEERIIRLEGNFWDIGEGPSGPNSEIFFMIVVQAMATIRKTLSCTQGEKMSVI